MKKVKMPFKMICTNCNKEVVFVDEKFNNDRFACKDIEIEGSPFYDSAIVLIVCTCGNEIQL